ncbi:hypothetical protein GNI_071810, partial [Gregarina niphandrodes]
MKHFRKSVERSAETSSLALMAGVVFPLRFNGVWFDASELKRSRWMSPAMQVELWTLLEGLELLTRLPDARLAAKQCPGAPLVAHRTLLQEFADVLYGSPIQRASLLFSVAQFLGRAALCPEVDGSAKKAINSWREVFNAQIMEAAGESGLVSRPTNETTANGSTTNESTAIESLTTLTRSYAGTEAVKTGPNIVLFPVTRPPSRTERLGKWFGGLCGKRETIVENELYGTVPPQPEPIYDSLAVPERKYFTLVFEPAMQDAAEKTEPMTGEQSLTPTEEEPIPAEVALVSSEPDGQTIKEGSQPGTKKEPIYETIAEVKARLAELAEKQQ